MLFIDLDNFKNINDTLGHDVGDELLRQVSRRLSECVRLEDTIARQGGDEFIVLLDNLDDGRNASIVAQKILNSLRQPLILGGTEQHVSGSVGIAVYPEDGRDAQTLMKNADTAMFHGKGLGKNTYQYFTAQMNIAVKRRMTLESALRRAVMQKDFVLHYQPQIDLETGEIIAVRGAGALEDRGQRHGDARRLHPARRGDRPHQRDRRMGAARGLPPGQGVAGHGPGRQPAHGDQPVGAPVRRQGLPRHGDARARRDRARAAAASSWRSPRAR